ncbi:hypothetical protein BJY22_000404 [Kribbella shirazensis]|uniref:Uncharacterized protein n=1 Tax=Kribbella shirazensis TaxID=1105143 RepID=A0A7X5V503_9ACTN|nr:hypothetical protein [Kribbella shirazensis]
MCAGVDYDRGMTGLIHLKEMPHDSELSGCRRYWGLWRRPII